VDRQRERNTVQVAISRVPGNPDLPVPQPATAGSVGVDLRACIREPRTLQPGARALIPTGFMIALPGGFEAQIRPRSGLAARQGLTLLNSPGTIDSDYRGEIVVVAINLGQEPVTIQRGDRIAQLIVAPVSHVTFVAVDELPGTARGEGGFGHTGVE
jgi:dUTP pyrophosphatase